MLPQLCSAGWLAEGSLPRDRYWLTRFVILRLLGCVYAAAFLSAARQILPLMGSDGFLPLGAYLHRLQEALGSRAAGSLRLPSLFWFVHSDSALQAAAWLGFALSCVVVMGYANALLMAVLWTLYMSFVHLGQEWYGYGWEIQLLETGFLSIFLCPLLDGRPFPRRAPARPCSGSSDGSSFASCSERASSSYEDPAWKDLTALDYHFETQPLPNPLSRWFHFLPRPLLRFGVLFNHLAELLAPWFVFYPHVARIFAGVVITLFQLTLILTGNLFFEGELHEERERKDHESHTHPPEPLLALYGEFRGLLTADT